MRTPPKNWNLDSSEKNQQILQSCRKKFLDSGIMECDKKLVIEFIEEKARRDQLSLGRQSRYFSVFNAVMPLFGKPLKESKLNDVMAVADEILGQNVTRKKKVMVNGKATCVDYKKDNKISKSTAATYLIMLKSLFKWLKRRKYVDIDMDELNYELKIPKEPIKRLRRDDIITWEEAVRLSNATNNKRDRAFIQLLWDSGARANEILTLRLKNVELIQKNQAAYIKIQESKNEAGKRDVVLIDCTPALIEYLDEHPFKGDENAPLWISRMGDAWKYYAATKMLKTTAKKIGFDKPVNMHRFRKSEASLRTELSDAETKARHGWTQGSKMLNIYRHPDLKKADNRLLASRGIIPQEQVAEEEVKHRPKKCAWCDNLNPAGNNACTVCKRPLDLKTVVKQEENKDKLISAIFTTILEKPHLKNEIMQDVLNNADKEEIKAILLATG